MPISIRLADSKDIQAVTAVEAENQIYPFSKKKLLSCFSDDYVNFVVCDGTTIVGFVLCFIGYDFLEIHNLCINERYRRQGLAKQLINQIKGYAIDKQIEKVFLEVRNSNQTALKLYQSIGFEQVGYRKNYYPTADNQFEDAILMNLEMIHS